MAGILGCSEPTAPGWSTESYLAVYGVLLAGSDTAAVVAQRGIEGSTSFEAVTDGQLGIGDGSSTTWLIRENPDLPGCIKLPPHSPGGTSGERDCYTGILPQPVSAQGTYQLRLLLASGDSAVGTTTVPGAPSILSPGPSQRWNIPVSADAGGAAVRTIPMRVEVAGPAARLEVLAGLIRVWGGGEEISPRLCETSAYATPILEPAQEEFDAWFYGATCFTPDGMPLPWDSLDLALTAVTYDENYHRYQERMVEGKEISRTGAGFGLAGAYGVFGAAHVTERAIRVVVDPSGG